MAYTADFPKISQQLKKKKQTSKIWPQCAPYLVLSSPKSGASGSWPQFKAWPLPGPLSPVGVAAIFRLLCGSCQVSLVRTQAAAEFALLWGPSQEASGFECPVATFRHQTQIEHHPAASSDDIPKSRLGRHKIRQKVNPVP